MSAASLNSTRALREAHAHYRAGRRAEAESACLTALRLDPPDPAALHLLAVLAHESGRLGTALDLALRAVAAAPSVPAYRNTLGIVLGTLGRWDESVAAFGEAIRLDPLHFDAHRNLGVTLGKARRLDEAVAPLERAAALRPGEPAVWNLLASLHHDRLDLPAALACRRRVVALRPRDFMAHAELLVALHYSPDYAAEQLFHEHLEWARRHERPLPGARRPHANARDPGRRLRVGYLSGDFREHPVIRFFLPLLRAHDRSAVRAYCYSDVACPDARTREAREAADDWRDVSGLSDEAVAEAVRADGIDVLVDLAGHMGNRRLPVFARRPAPVQVTYLGYPDTTGMRSMGYRITDGFHDPPGEPSGAATAPAGPGAAGPPDRYHTERLVRLPGCCLCYDPGGDREPPAVGALPALAGGRVTFAVFHRLIKVTPEAARLWDRLLGRVPGSRLVVIDSAGVGEAAVLRNLRRLGLAAAGAGRVGVLGRGGGGRREYLARYGGVDVALDPFPYNGVTTTCDALWMGVPTVTLAGRTHVSRAGVSLLSAVGLGELVARTPEQYVEIAAALASDPPRLAALRAGLRNRMRSSPLCDGRRVAGALEEAYRTMWRAWCLQDEEAGAAQAPNFFGP